MAPRGLSTEEKRVKLVEIFHESVATTNLLTQLPLKDFYQFSRPTKFPPIKLKELEKLGPKLKGIVSQSVKEVLQSLVDDGLVQGDKIGSSNFFWSFPSQRGTILQERLNVVNETRDGYETQTADLKISIAAEKVARPDSEERILSLETLAASKKELAMLEKELNDYGACDPAKVEEKRRAVTLAREATIRWTDNYSMLLSHFTRQTALNPEEVRKYLEIGDDYEDIC